jgi:hypothetical protein
MRKKVLYCGLLLVMLVLMMQPAVAAPAVQDSWASLMLVVQQRQRVQRRERWQRGARGVQNTGSYGSSS